MSRYIPAKFAPKLYSDWYLLIKKLPATKQAEVIRAIFEYPDYTPEGVDCWDFLSSRLSDQYERFLRNKEARTEAARKGAEARWGGSKTEQTQKSKRSEFLELTDDPDIIDILSDATRASDLCEFLATGNGSCYDALSEKEKQFVDRKDVRKLCQWHNDLQSATTEIKRRSATMRKYDLSFCESDGEKELCGRWLQYKANRTESYKDNQSVKLWFQKLKKMGGGDIAKMTAIVEDSMAQNYAGVYEPKQTKGKKTEGTPL